MTAPGTDPYERNGEWWFRWQNPTSGEIRPRGPFDTKDEALADLHHLQGLVPLTAADKKFNELGAVVYSYLLGDEEFIREEIEALFEWIRHLDGQLDGVYKALGFEDGGPYPALDDLIVEIRTNPELAKGVSPDGPENR